MWIVNPEISEGSGVLFDKRFRLTVTNAHVTGKQNITSTTNAGDLVYILGNPGGQDLWRWTLGQFLNDHGDFLHIQSDVFGGNSGGPVLNKQGILSDSGERHKLATV